MAYYGTQKKYEMAIPVILVLLVAIVVAAKMGIFCPPIIGDLLCKPPSAQILVIDENAGEAKALAEQINSIIRSNIATYLDDPCIIEGGYLTTNNFKLVILAGETTALPNHARDEITSYVENGGSLMILKGAGLKEYNSVCSETSTLSFNWRIDDMVRIIKFKPDCRDLSQCNEVSHITVTKDQMNDLTFTPINWEHPIIQRAGITIATKYTIENYPDFDSVLLVQDLDPKVVVAKWGWTDGEGKHHSTPAVIAYDAGTAGITGGRVVYLSYNPLQFGMNQETLFRNIIEWSCKET